MRGNYWSALFGRRIAWSITHLEVSHEGLAEPQAARHKNRSMTFPGPIAADDFDIGKISRTEKSIRRELALWTIVICSKTDLEEVIGHNLLKFNRLVVVLRNGRRCHYGHRGSGIQGVCGVGRRLGRTGAKLKMMLVCMIVDLPQVVLLEEQYCAR